MCHTTGKYTVFWHAHVSFSLEILQTWAVKGLTLNDWYHLPYIPATPKRKKQKRQVTIHLNKLHFICTTTLSLIIIECKFKPDIATYTQNIKINIRSVIIGKKHFKHKSRCKLNQAPYNVTLNLFYILAHTVAHTRMKIITNQSNLQSTCQQ